jgi:transposase
MLKNYTTQNEKIERISEKTLVIGVDIAKDSHYAQVVNWRKQEVRKGLSFQNRKDGYEKFLRWMQKALKQTEADDVLVAMEPTGTYYFVFEEYLEQLGIEVAIVNGRDVRRTSEIMGNDSSKNDPRDALIISQLTVDGRYGPSTRPKEGDYAELRELISLRELLATDDIRHKNRLYTQLSQLFPEHQEYQKRGFSIGMLAAMKHFGTLEKLIEAGPEGIHQLWQALHIKNYGQKKAQALYTLARTSIGIKRDSEAAAYKLSTLITNYENNQEELHETEEKIQQLLAQLPEAQLLMTIKGIGPIIAGTFLSEIGDIRHYNSPKQIQKLAGYAITSKESGKTHGKERSSKMGRKLLKTILYKAAIVLISTNKGFRQIYDYYTIERKKPLIKMKAVIAISCKLIRVFYAMLKNGTGYDEKKMLKDIHRSRSFIV